MYKTHSGVNAWSSLGDEVPKGVGVRRRCLPSPRFFCFFLNPGMAYFGEFCGAKFKVCNNIGGDIPVDVPKPKHWRGYVLGIPGGVDASENAAVKCVHMTNKFTRFDSFVYGILAAYTPKPTINVELGVDRNTHEFTKDPERINV